VSATTATTPWDGSLETLIRESTQYVYAVNLFTYAGAEITGLYVTSCTVRMDEYWTPYLQATVTIVLPSAATLALLDPRLRVRVEITAGYVLPGGLIDSHLLGIGYLARRTIDQPDNEVTLEVAGHEYLYEDWRDLTGNDWYPAVWNATTPARAGVHDCLSACKAVVDTTGWAFTEAMQDTGWADDPPDVWLPGQGDPALAFARDIAGRVEGWFRCDELGVWRLTPRPADAGGAEIVHYLRTGVDGTLISSAGTLSREGWANAVLVKYSWPPSNYAFGSSQIASGPYAVSTVGTVVRSYEYPWKGSGTNATKRARAAVRQLVGLGFAYTVDAVAAYWVRPTDVVSLDLGVEAPALAFVSSIAWDLDAGRMSLTTRQPMPATTRIA
jgi:hypothetical protein